MFGVASGTRRIGPSRFNKTLRRQILKRKQRIGKITAGRPPQLPAKQEALVAFLQKSGVEDNQFNRLIGAAILGEGPVSTRTLQFAKDKFAKAKDKFSSQAVFLKKLLTKSGPASGQPPVPGE